MAIRVRNGGTVDLATGQQWELLIEATELPVLVVTKPDGTTLTPAVDFEQVTDAVTWPWLGALPYGTYGYRAVVTVDAAGRWLAAVATAADGPAGALQAFVTATTATAAYPDGDSLDDWLGTGTHSFTPEKLTEKMDIALKQQRLRCYVPAAYPPDLREAVHRRAARLLYLERQLTEQPRTDGDYDTPPTFPPGRDFTTRELETPYYRSPVG